MLGLPFVELAALAASDPSGRQLVRLLDAMEDAPPDCPVTVQWLRHQPADKPLGMLVKITWDGNEWRQVYAPADLASRLEAHLPPEGRDGLAGKLLADLKALS